MKASIVNAEGQQVDGVIINVKLRKPLNISFGGTVTIPYIFPLGPPIPPPPQLIINSHDSVVGWAQ